MGVIAGLTAFDIAVLAVVGLSALLALARGAVREVLGLVTWIGAVMAAIVAFAPGGLEAMTVLALILSLDPLYVGIHHLVRFLGIGLVLPFVVAWLQRSKSVAVE